jgi:hypothetical protein
VEEQHKKGKMKMEMELFSVQVKEKLALLFAKREEAKTLSNLYVNSMKEFKSISDEISESCGDLFVIDGVCYQRSIEDIYELNVMPRIAHMYKKSDAVKVFK